LHGYPDLSNQTSLRSYFGFDSSGAVPRSSSCGSAKAEQISLQKEVRAMPVYEIYRRYRFEAANPTQALKKLFDAVEADKEEDFHVSDSVRESDESAGTDKPAGMGTLLKRQITGR
jgi:hypothetical protein